MDMFFKVKTVEYMKDDKEFGGNFCYFKIILEEDKRLEKTEFITSINKYFADAINSTKSIPKRSIPNKCFKED